MSRFLSRVLIGVVILAALVGLALAAARFVLVPRNFPKVDGTIRLQGLDGPVDVYRDNLGIPQIYASTEHDLLMAQGFVQAQDRFWQMEFQRRIGSGRLSEVLGEATLDTDRFIRTVGWARTAAQEAELLDGEDRALLQAFADGVNAYLTEHRGPKGLEFTILGLTGVKVEPEPWTLLDSLTWGKVMAWNLGGESTVELTRAEVADKLGAPAIAQLMPPYDSDYPTIVSQLPSPASLSAVPDLLYASSSGDSLGRVGSNSWVISGERTATGAPMLENDPHLGIQMPSIWYEIGLHCQPVGPDCGFNVTGASLLGVPGVVIGHNQRIAWGFTNLGPDVVDFFIERPNPDNPNQYEYQGQWEDMQVVREEIQVAGQDEPEVVNARITRHGPIINDVIGGVQEDWTLGWEPLAMSWTALEPSTTLRAILMLDRAGNWDEFRQAMSYFDVPSQNTVYADVDGNIGYQAPGRIPIRAAGDGSMPVPGWDGEYEWIGTIPFEELPYAFNPPEGYIVAANNKVVGDDYPYFLSMDWAPGYRARRITELIQADESISMVDMQAMQNDVSPLYAQDILHYILAVDVNDANLLRALDILRSWDGRTNRDSAGAALFETLRIKLIDATFQDELGDQLLSQLRGYLAVALANMLDDPHTAWFDDINTVEVEDRDTIIVQALEATVEQLNEQLGNDPNQWRWGELHTATFVNGSLGISGIGPIEALFNRGPFEVDGTGGAINNTGFSLKGPYSITTVPSYRQLVDLGDLSRSLSIHTTGESGHPFNPHYDDMIDLWRNGQYHPMLWDRTQVEAAAVNVLRLEP